MLFPVIHYRCDMLKHTKHIELTAVFWRDACNALKNRILMGGGKSLRLIQATCLPEAFRMKFSTPCLPAWGVVVCAGAIHNAPADGADAPVLAETDIFSLINFNCYGY